MKTNTQKLGVTWNEEKKHYVVTDRNGNFFAKTYSSTDARAIALIPELIEAIKLCQRELSGMHSHHHPTCEGGCPFDEANKKAKSVILKLSEA